jgi:CubicO group peptidase (beta-lactamase class C family)
MTKITIFCLLLGFCSRISFADTAAPGGQDIETVLNQFEAYAESAQKQWGIPGMAIAIVKDDQVIFAKGFGVKRVGGTDPVDPNTVLDWIHIQSVHIRSGGHSSGRRQNELERSCDRP